MIYVYAIVEVSAERPLPLIPGFLEDPVSIIVAGSVGAACGHAPPASLSPSTVSVLRHERVVEALMEDRAILPVKFGTTFDNERSLQTLLMDRADEFLKALDQVRGCAELGVRVLSKGDGSGADSPTDASYIVGGDAGAGRSYMLKRLAAEQRTEAAERRNDQIAAAVHDELSRNTRAAARRPARSSEILMTAAYLVPRDQVAVFVERVQHLATAHPTLRLLCTGPWPPYHFVSPLLSTEAVHA